MNSRAAGPWFVGVAWVCLCAPAVSAADGVADFVQRHCLDCHGGDAPEAELSLETLAREGLSSIDLPLLERLRAQLRTGAMPPPDQSRPEAAELARVLAEFDAEHRRRIEAAAHPGRVTMRRLNRSEYNDTVRDLFGIDDLRPADDFPADDLGYGFDNIGDVLTLPPALAERYLAAAEKIAQRALPAPETYEPPRRAIDAAEFAAPDGEGKLVRGRNRLSSNGQIAHEIEIAFAGEYEIDVLAAGDQAGGEPPRMVVTLANQERTIDVGAFGVAATRRNPEHYRAKVPLESGRYSLQVAFTNDYYRPEAPEKEGRDRNLDVYRAEVVGPLALREEIKPAIYHQLIPRTPSADGSDWREIARDGLRPFLRRAYRRPVSDEEVDRLAALVPLAFEQGESCAAGMQWAVAAALTSPHFLFHVEQGGDAASDEPLGSHVLASRLSYFLWNSLPDDELSRLADEGRLADPAVLEAQARRLLADPRSRRFVQNFAEQWLHLRELWRRLPDPQRYPDFDDALRRDMFEETLRTFEYVVDEDRSVLEFIDADYAFLNERLARHYGVSGVSGEEFRRVTLADRRRGGLITQASVLTVTSNPTRTSPVKRGKWVLEQLLGESPPPPPPGVPPLAEDAKSGPLTGTLRQRMEQHRADPSCAACHRRMDAVGFGLENFDPIGTWRDRDGETPIDAAAEFAPGQSFAGPVELKALLRADPRPFYRTLAEKLLTYALGRGLELHDRLAVEKIADAAEQSEGRFSSFVTSIVASEPFRYRRSQGVEP